MKKKITPQLGTGLLMFVAYIVTDRFITPISDWLAIPLLVVSVVLIIIGGFKTKESK